MPVPATSHLPETVIVSRLRAAGCVFAEDEARLLIAEAVTATDLAILVDRRIAGLPLEHVLGWAEFCGQRMSLEPGVFVPRRRTELLVRQAIPLATANATTSANAETTVVVDLCCGSGAVGAALGAALGDIELHAVDVDPTAVRCARRNVAAVPGRVYQGDLYQPLPSALGGRVDILVANAPYVPTGAVQLLPPEARVHEPRVALDGGADGLDVLRRVIAGAPRWLAPGGWLLVETSERQAPALVEAATREALAATTVHDGELGATVVAATVTGVPPGPAVR